MGSLRRLTSGPQLGIAKRGHPVGLASEEVLQYNRAASRWWSILMAESRQEHRCSMTSRWNSYSDRTFKKINMVVQQAAKDHFSESELR